MICFYRARHKDASPLQPSRKLTMLYYVNPGWTEAAGGTLRLYPPGREPTDVAPILDRLLVFLADVEHEVLPAVAPRFTLTVWVRTEVSPRSLVSRLGCWQAADDEAVRAATADAQAPPSIFVAIPSYRDAETRATVASLMEAATHPSRVTVGICWQVADVEETRVFDGEPFAGARGWLGHRE